LNTISASLQPFPISAAHNSRDGWLADAVLPRKRTLRLNSSKSANGDHVSHGQLRSAVLLAPVACPVDHPIILVSLASRPAQVMRIEAPPVVA
jgi:hypothetical protein